MNNGEYLTRLGKKIRAARKAKKLTLDKVAQQCDLNLNTLAFIEKGEQNAHILTLKGIADVLKMDVKEFL